MIRQSRPALVSIAVFVAASMVPSAVPEPAFGEEETPVARTMAEVLGATEPSDWRSVRSEEMLIVDLASGRVVIELAPAFAPKHVGNIRTLVRQEYFDGLVVRRVQDNYVVQWGDPAESPEDRRSLGKAAAGLAPELDRPSEGLPFTPLPDGDVYAPEVGLSGGFPVARNPSTGRVWLAHCYGMVGVGRGVAPDSGNGSELYVVIGHAPRHLDRNVTLVGRVLRGMEHLSSLRRGKGSLGFYEDAEDHVPIRSIRMASDLSVGERKDLQVLRTDTEAFRALVRARRHRTEDWFLDPVGAVGLCNVPVPARTARENLVSPGERSQGSDSGDG